MTEAWSYGTSPRQLYQPPFWNTNRKCLAASSLQMEHVSLHLQSMVLSRYGIRDWENWSSTTTPMTGQSTELPSILLAITWLQSLAIIRSRFGSWSRAGLAGRFSVMKDKLGLLSSTKKEIILRLEPMTSSLWSGWATLTESSITLEEEFNKILKKRSTGMEYNHFSNRTNWLLICRLWASKILLLMLMKSSRPR